VRVTVVWATPQVQDVVAVELPPGSTVADAIACSGLLVHYGLDPARLGYAIYGRRAGAHTRLVEHDRIELTRALGADPKEMRRRRARAAPSATPSPPAKRRRVP
jgi:putative ubiquitin-RnfH superfamily antitoxin RatB of RatAB toxin-antitoxin module